MTERHEFSFPAGYVEVRNDPDYSVQNSRCCEVGGIHFCPSSSVQASSHGPFVAIMQTAGPAAGLMTRITPLGAREFAAALLRAADAAEAHLAASANAQLDQALSRKPRGGDQA